MKRLLFLAYLVVEIGVFVGLSVWLNFGWALLIAVVAGGAGLILLARRGRAVFGDLARASRNEIAPDRPLTDTALLAVSTMLLIVPGIVTSILGLLLLAKPVRRLLAPAVAAFGARKFASAVDRAGLYATGVMPGTVVDGTVFVESTVVDSTSYPHAATQPQIERGH
ncbi:FxsA family protein [Gordonia sp. CPCC 205333]|uniref:FxsA family protein n=1 Tax=Gordonia sp. CPCC 205333 TaxID=3140790 RepID=UPI003AF39577